MNKEEYAKKIKKEIVLLQQYQKILRNKNPNHQFLEPLIGNTIASMVDLVIYLEGKNPYYVEFNEAFFNNRQAAMHRTFFSDFHVVTEDGLRKIIKKKNFRIVINKQALAFSIIEKIRKKISNHAKIKTELKRIVQLAGNHPTFNDYLNTVINSIKSLDQGYIKETRDYFDAVNVIRNKVSHSDMSLTEKEKETLIKGRFKNAVSSQGKLQMTFEGYKNLIRDIIQFFDTLYSKC